MIVVPPITNLRSRLRVAPSSRRFRANPTGALGHARLAAFKTKGPLRQVNRRPLAPPPRRFDTPAAPRRVVPELYLAAERAAERRKYAIASLKPLFDAGLPSGTGKPLVLGQSGQVHRFRRKRHHKRRFALAGVVKRVAVHRDGRHQGVGLDPVERIVARRLLCVIVGRFFVPPPAFSALPLKKGEDGLPGS